MTSSSHWSRQEKDFIYFVIPCSPRTPLSSRVYQIIAPHTPKLQAMLQVYKSARIFFNCQHTIFVILCLCRIIIRSQKNTSTPRLFYHLQKTITLVEKIIIERFLNTISPQFETGRSKTILKIYNVNNSENLKQISTTEFMTTSTPALCFPTQHPTTPKPMYQFESQPRLFRPLFLGLQSDCHFDVQVPAKQFDFHLLSPKIRQKIDTKDSCGAPIHTQVGGGK